MEEEEEKMKKYTEDQTGLNAVKDSLGERQHKKKLYQITIQIHKDMKIELL